MLSPADYDTVVAAFSATGFSGADAWYLNEAANIAYAGEALNFGRLTLPVLFIHAGWDTVCESAHGSLAEPMRADCADLHEVTIEGGHELMLERPVEVNKAIASWLSFLEEGVPLRVVARESAIPYRTAQHWAMLYRNSGLAALGRRGRSDRGRHRGLSSKFSKSSKLLRFRNLIKFCLCSTP
jgi:hypothetical protein